MPDKSSIEKLIDNSPLALVVIGVVLFVIGAAGGWPSPALEVNEAGWRIALATFGVVVAGIGGLLLWRERTSRPPEVALSPEDYGIKIVSPKDGTSVSSHCAVLGTYQNKPPDGSVWLFAASDSEYWPQETVKFDTKTKTWYASANLGKSGLIKIVLMGKAGQALCEYYFKVGRITDKYWSIETLTPDIVECSRVTVILV